jgi:3-deoxy-D-manno-octulosonate 8-phosphate phosphatase (KDO 8-P phosphatase)
VDRVVSQMIKIDAAALAIRAGRITHVLTDCDGVLTDATVYCSAAGEELLRFSRRDGMGVQRLREAGITCAIVTRERSPIVARRAEKLGIVVHAGIDDKRTWLVAWLLQQGLQAAQVAYIGDDVNDLEIAAAVEPHGLTGAPADAEPQVAEAVHFVSGRCGGAGAFREFADLILGARGSGISTEGSKPWA